MTTLRMGREDRGAVSIEYALLGAIVGIGIVSGLMSLKAGLNTNYDRITLDLNRANAASAGPRSEVGRTTLPSYYSDGILINQVRVTYNDGTAQLLTTSPDPKAWFKTITDEFDASGNNIGAFGVRTDGSTYSQLYTAIRPGVTAVDYTDGSTARSYIQQQTDLGGNYYAYRITVNSSNVPGDWSGEYFIKYTGVDANGNNVDQLVGAVYTYPDGSTVKTGGDISSYMR